MSRPAVIIMAKAPRAGEVKTRLVPPLSAEDAAALAACFFADALRLARHTARETIVAYAPTDARAALEQILRDDAGARTLEQRVRWLEQRGDTLGARLSSVVEQAFALSFGPLAVIGTDSPTLPRAFVKTALKSLARNEADAALGPTEDGGFYTVALSRPTPELFRAVEWSTPRAFEQTARNAARLGLRLLELPRWYDVDTRADLLRLREELFTDADARRRAPAVYEWVRRNDRACAD
jgi:rSAM/selenodomain-associated transferase 1